MTPTNARPELPIAIADEAAFFDLLDLNRPELEAVKRAVAVKDWTAAKLAWARHLETRTAPQWVWSRRDKAGIVAFLEAKDGGLKRYIPAADAVLARRFTIQGVPYQLQKNLDWQLNLSEETHVLSRMAYWRDLGLAYWQTGEAKYATDFVSMLGDWVEDNPAPRDLSGAIRPNTRWRTLETGIRVVNWWEAAQFFMDAPEFDASAKYRMSKSLVEHARYLYEWTPQFRHGNWQVSEAGGLAIMGIMLPEAKDAKIWRERGFARLAEHMQVASPLQFGRLRGPTLNRLAVQKGNLTFPASPLREPLNHIMNYRISPRLFLGLLTFSPLLTNMTPAAPVTPVTPAAPAAPAAPDPLATISIGVADEAAFFGLLNLDLPALAQVKAAVEAKDWMAAKAAWARHLETRTSPQWLWSRRDKERIIKILNEKDNGLTRFIEPANEILARRFAPQGVLYQLEKNIDWQLKLSEETHVMSRMPYWRGMGLAYWQTGDAKYAADFVYILNDWLDDNPVPTNLVIRHNTRWRGLEAGIRADTWWDTIQFFMDAPEFDASAKYRMTKSLVEHARFLHLLQTSFRGGNGQFNEASGLVLTAMMLPEVKESAAWRQRGLDMIGQHMQKNVVSDGAYSEFTPGYHSWVENQSARVAQMCKLNGYKVPELLDRHEKMYDWQLRISKPDRSAPQIGDARGTALGNDMATGALLYNRSDLRYLGSPEGPPSWVWTFGADALDKYAKIPAKKPDFLSTMTEESHFLVMRTGWERTDNYLLFNNHPWGGTHSHSDRMSLVLHAGRELLVDPGILNYNQPLSMTYLKTGEAHNIILVDGKEQPKFDPEILAWKTTPQADFGSAMIEGDGIRQQRSVLFVKPGYWVVVDHLTGEGEHEVKRLFHFPIGEAQFTANSAQTAFPTGMNLQVQSADDSKLEPGKGWIVVSSIKAEEAPAAVFVSKGRLPMTLISVLTPFSDAKMLPKVERIAGTDPQIAHIKLSFANGQSDEIAVGAEPRDLKIGEVSGQARALVVRRGPQGNETIRIAP